LKIAKDAPFPLVTDGLVYHLYAISEGDDVAEWVKRDHGKGTIDRAGKFLLEWWSNPDVDIPLEDWSPAFQIVENWRACHGLPLNVIQAGLRGRIRRAKQDAIVAQRLNRFPSIMNKLVREPDMKLSQMQD
jgi:putative GTP pyrophosphokinase